MRISGVPPAVVPFYDRSFNFIHKVFVADLPPGSPTMIGTQYTIPTTSLFLLYVVKLEVFRVSNATTVGVTEVELFVEGRPLFEIRGLLPNVNDRLIAHFVPQIWLPPGKSLTFSGLDQSTGGQVRADVWFAGAEFPTRPG